VRLRLQIDTAVAELPWGDVHRPGRGVVYAALEHHAPALGRQLHDHGIGLGVRPFCFAPPTFPNAPRRRGVYMVGGRGSVIFASPLPEVIEALTANLATSQKLDWGDHQFDVVDMDVEHPPAFASGVATFTTVTPVVVKAYRSDRFLTPKDDGFTSRLRQVSVRKLDALGLPSTDFGVEVGWTGSVRQFRTSRRGSTRVGCRLDAKVSGAPEALSALRDAGLGHDSPAGFGMVA
jgi:CRISPR-associated endoribonuclease Cas6